MQQKYCDRPRIAGASKKIFLPVDLPARALLSFK